MRHQELLLLRRRCPWPSLAAGPLAYWRLQHHMKLQTGVQRLSRRLAAVALPEQQLQALQACLGYSSRATGSRD